MGKILFFLARREDKEMVETIFASQNDGEWELETGHVTGVKPILKANIEADAVIARGVTGVAIARMLRGIPVVELSVTGYDVMRAVMECKRRFSSQKVAMVGAPNMFYGADSIRDFMEIDVVTVTVENEEEAERGLKDLRKRGFTDVIGGGMAVDIARQLGMNAIFIQSGPEAVFRALLEAKNLAHVRQYEQERGEQFRTILDYTAEGIVAVDAAGRVNLANKAALKLAGVSDQILGDTAGEIVSSLGLNRVLQTKQAEIGFFDFVGGNQVAINCVPIVINDKPAGAVAAFQPVTAIQELESKIRQKIYRRGLVAKSNFTDIVSASSVMRETMALAQEYAKVDSNVLILGETGTGKEIFAQSIHNSGKRSAGAFVPINCAALPENLLESELFGYVEGAFTGAAKGGKVGLFEQAHRGTIFLDEISEISPRLQGRLLRVLQEREIMRLGDDRVIPIDVRIIAATNRNLHKMMREGQFRADLYYRLDILKLTLPPLRHRKEDIVPLMRHFMKTYAVRFQKPFVELSAEAKNYLVEYAWPGNVRELRNIAERLTVLGQFSPQGIEIGRIRSVLTQDHDERPEQGELRSDAIPQWAERIRDCLRHNNNHYGKAADQLGISRTTLWRRIKAIETSGRNVFETKKRK